MRKVLVVVLSAALFSTACSTGWVSTLDSILAAAAPALINILQIVAIANGEPMNNGLEAKINADASVIKTLAGDFATASSGSGSGVCEQLQAAVTVYEADQQLVLQAAQVSDSKTQTKITLLVDLVAGAVNAITDVIPSCGNSVSFKGMETEPPYGVSSFVAHYNRILVAQTGNSAVDSATRKMKLHQHSKVMRSMTFGLLN